MRLLLPGILFFFHFQCTAQSTIEIDRQQLPSLKTVSLISRVSTNDGQMFFLVFKNQKNNDSMMVKIENINHVPCGGPNSVFFVNDSVGFITESGGCYANYNWLYRTSDKGKTWKAVITETGITLNPVLSKKCFYMFNSKSGVIVWQMDYGQLLYRTTSDGGLTWEKKSQKLFEGNEMNSITDIHFVKNGNVTLVITNDNIPEPEKKSIVVLQSNNYGASFQVLK